MSSRKQRQRLWAEERMAFDDMVERDRKARESDLTAQEKETLTPKKKPAKSTKKAAKKENK